LKTSTCVVFAAEAQLEIKEEPCLICLKQWSCLGVTKVDNNWIKMQH